jgi:hypothetical protein
VLGYLPRVVFASYRSDFATNEIRGSELLVHLAIPCDHSEVAGWSDSCHSHLVGETEVEKVLQERAGIDIAAAKFKRHGSNCQL